MSTATHSDRAKSSEVAIFCRLLINGQSKMSPDLARYVLTLGFNDEDQDRMRNLAAGNQEGALSSEEHEELMTYVKAGHLLALLHSKARRSLQHPENS